MKLFATQQEVPDPISYVLVDNYLHKKNNLWDSFHFHFMTELNCQILIFVHVKIFDIQFNIANNLNHYFINKDPNLFHN